MCVFVRRREGFLFFDKAPPLSPSYGLISWKREKLSVPLILFLAEMPRTNSSSNTRGVGGVGGGMDAPGAGMSIADRISAFNAMRGNKIERSGHTEGG